MIWPTINPKAKPLPRIITCTVWAGCVHEPDRVFTEIITWRDPKFHIYDFLGLQRKSSSLTPKEWERFTQLYDPDGVHRKIDLKWHFFIPGKHQKYRDICKFCNESADLYLLGKPVRKNRSDYGSSWFTFLAYQSTNTWKSDLLRWKGASQIFLTMNDGPCPVFPLMALPSQACGNLNLNLLLGPYGACTFMNQQTSPVHNQEEAILLKQTFEKLMGWQFLDKSTDRLKELIRQGSTLHSGQIPPEPADLEVEGVEDPSGWIFRGPLQISDGPDWSDEKIYHRCALRVDRDGTVSFQHIKELVEQYPGYQ